MTAAPPVLLPYQRAWIDDQSPLKVCEKSRRTGLTWAEASDDVLIAASRDGQNIYYIGYNQDMAIEYIEACAAWAKTFHCAASAIDEGIWGEDDPDRHIKTYTIRFGSGRRIVALSSRPANLRGKQGVVVIDEAAYHDKLAELLKAALALLIWGGRVRVISSHNGDANPFNQLINDIRSGRRNGSVQRIEFRQAVEQGLYRRVCLRLGKTWSAPAEAEWMQEVYAYYGDDATEELDVVPSAGDGVPLTRAAIEAVMRADVPLEVLRLDDQFAQHPMAQREAEVHDWCETHLLPLLERIPPNRNCYVGEDFGRTIDLTDIWIASETATLGLETAAVIELRNVPYEQQRQVVFYVIDRLPRFAAAAFDASGNGGYLAEVAMQRYGASRIEQIKLSTQWYLEHMPRLIATVQDRGIDLPRHADVLADLRCLRRVGGVIRIPDGGRARGSDGGQRHGDSAIALAMMLYARAAMEPVVIDYESTGSQRLGREVDQYGGYIGKDTGRGFGVVGKRLASEGYQ